MADGSRCRAAADVSVTARRAVLASASDRSRRAPRALEVVQKVLTGRGTGGVSDSD